MSRTQSRIPDSRTLSPGPHPTIQSAAARAIKIPVDRLQRILKDHILRRYDDVIDAFNEIDINGNGRIRFAL